MMRRLCPFTGEHASEILEDIFIGIENATAAGLTMSAFDAALYVRLKRFEVNSKEVYDNFYETLAKPPR